VYISFSQLNTWNIATTANPILSKYIAPLNGFLSLASHLVKYLFQLMHVSLNVGSVSNKFIKPLHIRESFINGGNSSHVDSPPPFVQM
jgi:hypothetical protein